MGNWNREGVPRKGWQCMDVFDLAEEAEQDEDIPYEQCEMCGNEKIRYVHIMRHPEFPDELHVGCVCAEKMTDDYVNPRKYETALKNKAARRRNFNKVDWRFNSVKNTYSKKYKGEYITIMQGVYGGWGIFFANQKIWEYDGRRIRSFEDAEKVAFEIFEQYNTTKEERDYQFMMNRMGYRY